MWDEQKQYSSGCQWGCWGSVICSPAIPETWLLCGYTETALPGCRVRAPETKGALPLNVTNMMWHVSACSGTSSPFTHTPPFLSLAHKHPHIYTKKNVAFSISLSQSQTQKHKDTQTEICSYSLVHEHAHTRTHMHTHAHSTPRVAVKSSHSALHCKSNSLLLFSLALAFSFLPAQSSSPLCCLPVIPRHPTSPTPLLPPYS